MRAVARTASGKSAGSSRTTGVCRRFSSAITRSAVGSAARVSTRTVIGQSVSFSVDSSSWWSSWVWAVVVNDDAM